MIAAGKRVLNAVLRSELIELAACKHSAPICYQLIRYAENSDVFLEFCDDFT